MVDRPTFDVVYNPALARDFLEGDEICIRLPKSLLPVLAGALEPFTFPDAYRGSVQEQILASRQVETWLAQVLTNAGCEVTVVSSPGQCGGAIVIESEAEMGQVVTKVEVQDGVLYVEYGPCCIETYELGGGKILGFKQPPDDYTFPIPEYGPTWTYSACAKAHALVNVQRAAVDSLLDSAAKSELPFTAWANLRNNVPGVTFGQADVLNAYGYALGIVAQGLASETEEEAFYQTLVCQFAGIMDDNQQGATEQQYSDMKGALTAAANNYYPLTDIVVAYFGVRGIHQSVFSAIGANDVRSLTTAVPHDASLDCDCPNLGPGYNTVPDTAGWYFRRIPDMSGTFEVDDAYWNGFAFTLHSEHDVFGLVFDHAQGAPLTDFNPMDASTMSQDSVIWLTDEPEGGYTTFNGNTSNQGLGGRLKICTGSWTVWDQVLDPGTYNKLVNGQSWSSDPQNPAAMYTGEKDYVCYYRVSPSNAINGTVDLKWVYVLHNINSPSHQV